MDVYDQNMNVAVKTKFPDEIFKGYLNRIGVSELDKLSDFDIDKILGMVIVDFRSGKVMLEELSDVCNVLFGRYVKIKSKRFLGDLGDVLLEGSELSWTIRQENVEKKLIKQLNRVLSWKSGGL
jgi:hypothetical protein